MGLRHIKRLSWSWSSARKKIEEDQKDWVVLGFGARLQSSWYGGFAIWQSLEKERSGKFLQFVEFCNMNMIRRNETKVCPHKLISPQVICNSEYSSSIRYQCVCSLAKTDPVVSSSLVIPIA